MANFEHYYNNTLLCEKVTKKEIDEALANPNIMVGAEFEFIMTKGGKEISFVDEDLQAEFNDAYDEWEYIIKLMKRYEKEAEIYYRETDKLRMKYDQIGLDIDKLNNQWQAAVSKKEQKKMNTLSATIKIKQMQYMDMENEIGYRDDEGHTLIEMPPSSGKQTEYYAAYVEEYMGLRADTELQYTFEGQPPTEPVDISQSTEAEFKPKDIMRVFDNFKDAPFKKYKIGGFGEVVQNVGSTTWAIEPDGSLGSSGLEVKSPPLPLPEFMKILPKMFDWVNKHGKTTSATGFHVHMSLKGVSDLRGVLDPIKIVLFTDEGFVFNIFSERMNNQYTKSMTNKLKSGSIPTKKELSAVFDTKAALTMIASFDHDDAINLQNMAQGHMEFRHMGGADYSKRTRDVSLTIGHFAHALAVATDAGYKKKEYTEKLRRIFNKIDLYSLEKKIFKMEFRLKQIKDTWHFTKPDQKNVDLILKNWKSSLAVLSKIYKIDSKTRKLLDGNAGFQASIWQDYGTSFKSLSFDGKKWMQVK